MFSKSISLELPAFFSFDGFLLKKEASTNSHIGCLKL
jgi:hypothetical protein